MSSERCQHEAKGALVFGATGLQLTTFVGLRPEATHKGHIRRRMPPTRNCGNAIPVDLKHLAGPMYAYAQIDDIVCQG